ncbi:MICOS complex subunit Mic60 [Anabrus simplex]|uniref:MICOS complex subunit Mic60 n=1 Tax=Anabrus simplex TaxID=316456 RepID=UPI0035A32D08
MFRIRLKFPCRGFPRIYRDGPPRIYITKRYCQSKCQPEAPGTKHKPHRRDVGGGATGFYYTVGTLTFITGATVAYAKYDPDFRGWLAMEAPWTDDALSFIYQEEKTWMEHLNDVKKKIKSSAWKIIFGKDAASRYEKSEQKKEVCLDIKEKKEYKLAVTGEKQEKVDEYEEDLTKLPKTHPRNLVDLEAKISESASLAIAAYNDAICALREHTREVYQLVEESIERADAKIWNNLKVKAEKKERTTKEAEEKARFALLNVHKLKAIIEDENFEAPEDLKSGALRNIARVLDELEAAEEELREEKKKASITDKYWHKVEEARKHYTEELEILFPSVKISEKDWNIPPYDLDLFILHCFQNVLYYQKELEKLEVLGEERIREALESAAVGSDESLIQAAVEAELEKEKRALAIEFQKKILSLKVESEKEMRLQLKRQAEAHSDHLLDAVAVREKELEREFLRMQDEKMATEQAKFKYQLAGMMGRLKGLETSLKARASADRNAHQAQLLWSACQALHSSISYSVSDKPWEDQLRPLESEVNSIKKAALGEDVMVDSIIKGIPSEAIKRGVYSEEALRERFLSVEKTARQIALVPEGGASLPIYFLSYLQSLLLIKAVNPISQAELADEPVEFANLDTYDILMRSRYWLDRGNFEMVLRYMNLLKGASRSAALDWMNEARILLETQQAANALMVHAGATGLLYI